MYKVSLLQQWSATWNVIQNETGWSNSIQRFIFATNDTASSNLTGKINIILFIYEDRKKKMEEGLCFIFIYILRFNLQISPLNSDWRHIWTWFSPPLMHKWNPHPEQKSRPRKPALARLMINEKILTNRQTETGKRNMIQTFRLHLTFAENLLHHTKPMFYEAHRKAQYSISPKHL